MNGSLTNSIPDPFLVHMTRQAAAGVTHGFSSPVFTNLVSASVSEDAVRSNLVDTVNTRSVACIHLTDMRWLEFLVLYRVVIRMLN